MDWPFHSSLLACIPDPSRHPKGFIFAVFYQSFGPRDTYGSITICTVALNLIKYKLFMTVSITAVNDENLARSYFIVASSPLLG